MAKAKKTKSNIQVSRTMPGLQDILSDVGARHAVLFADERILSRPNIRKWSDQFQSVVQVRSGESLKSIDEYPRLARMVLRLTQGFAPQEVVLVALGGGSVGDAAGFLASTLKRGLTFVNIPSTWLSAIDSAHGGKTAMNVDDSKNQVGTFYPAHRVYLVEQLLKGQPIDNIRSGLGEAMKMAILSGRALFQRFVRAKDFSEDFLWLVLPALIKGKLDVVKKDPFEKKGVRLVLNLGHTFGHAIELESLLPHGVAVQIGMQFAVDFSRDRGHLSAKDHEVLQALLNRNAPPAIAQISTERLQLRLTHDKKSTGGDRVRFVFLKKAGKPFVETVTIRELIDSARRLGWAR